MQVALHADPPPAVLQDMFGFREGDFRVTEKAGRTSIAVPFHNNLTSDGVEYVAEVLEEGVRGA